MKINTQIKTWFFLICSGLFLMQDKLQDWFTPFQYFDEAFGLLIIPALLLRHYQKQPLPRLSKKTVLFCVFFACFWLWGWAGWLAYRYQPFAEALKDSYVNLKFFLAIGATFLIFDDPEFDFRKLKTRLWPVLNAVTLLLFILCVIDLFFGVFSTDTRGGLRAVKLFYSAQTVLVANCVFLSCIYLWYYDQQKKRIIVPLLLLCIMMFCTIRVKAMGAIACIVVVYLLVLRRQQGISKMVKLFTIGLLVFSAAAIIYQFVSYYFTMGTESARAMLTLASPFVAWDHFPYGSGWASFGSAFSAEPHYSPVYGMYRMSGIWGLSPSYNEFVSDTYWPMLLAQSGFFGFLAFIAALVIFVQKVLSLKINRAALASAVNVLLYLLISSTSESALANPMAVPLAFWLGFLLARHHRAMAVKGRELPL